MLLGPYLERRKLRPSYAAHTYLLEHATEPSSNKPSNFTEGLTILVRSEPLTTLVSTILSNTTIPRGGSFANYRRHESLSPMVLLLGRLLSLALLGGVAHCLPEILVRSLKFGSSGRKLIVGQ